MWRHNINPASVEVMACYRPSTSHGLCQSWPDLCYHMTSHDLTELTCCLTLNIEWTITGSVHPVTLNLPCCRRYFHEWSLLYFDYLSYGPDWQCASSGLDNGLAPIRWQIVSEPVMIYYDDPYIRQAALVCSGAYQVSLCIYIKLITYINTNSLYLYV